MNDEPIVYEIDWTLGQAAFRNLVRDYIRQAEKKGKVLALSSSCPEARTLFSTGCGKLQQHY